MTTNTQLQESFGRYAEAVARAFWGEPTTRTAKEMRFGARGSKCVDLEKGTWYDHERGQGGGVLDLIMDRGEAANHPQAVRWLESNGIHQPTAAEKPRQRMVARYPYLDADGVLLFEVCRMDPKDFRQRRPDGSAPGGWTWSVRGVQQVPYRLPDMLAAPDPLVFVCEGEKDADALHDAGLVATCNAGGAGKWPDALTPHFAGRRVCVLPDNDQAGREHAAKVAAQLHAVAAEVRVLDLAQHWPGMPHKGDVSDWLAAGNEPSALSHLAEAAPLAAVAARDEERRAKQRAENERLQELPFSTLPPVMTVDAMLEDCVWIAMGSQVGRISNPRSVLTFGEFADLTAASVSVELGDDGRKRRMPHAVKWKQSEQRHTVITRTFHPGAPIICADPDGQPALNSWRPIQRTPATVDVSAFLDQVAYLVPDASEREAFLDWLAHLEQRPGELPHYGWLHIAEHTGTGRNWLASLLARVWRGYVAPNVDLPALLDSQFNGQLAGRVLAIVDEVQEGAGENPHRHTNRLKSLVNAEYRDLNPKFGRQYREHNACRWLVFSNHDNALPLNDTDRRWRVVKHAAAPRDPGVYAALYARLADAEFVNAVGVYLQQRDLSGFNPGERPPMNDAKRTAVAASKTLIQRYAEDLVARWPADVIANADAAQVLSDGAESTVTPAMRRALEELGAAPLRGATMYVQGRSTRGWILRNRERWETAKGPELTAEAVRARPLGSGQVPALELMHAGTQDRPF